MSALSQHTDQELTGLVKAGDAAAFTELYDRYSEQLYRHAYRWLKDHAAVEDVLQEIFAILWDKREQLSIQTNPGGYLFVTVRRAVMTRIMKENDRRKYLVSMKAHFEHEANETDFRVREKQLQALIDQHIEALPERMRLVFTLSRYEQLSYAEIAKRLDISEETVRSQVKNALRVLREKLGIVVYFYLLLKK